MPLGYGVPFGLGDDDDPIPPTRAVPFARTVRGTTVRVEVVSAEEHDEVDGEGDGVRSGVLWEDELGFDGVTEFLDAARFCNSVMYCFCCSAKALRIRFKGGISLVTKSTK